jgi:hypothetical protein
MLPATIKHTYVFVCNARCFCPILTQFGFSCQIFMRVRNTKCHENQPSGSRAYARGQRDERTVMAKIINALAGVRTQRTFFYNDTTAPIGPGPPHHRGFTSHTPRTPLDKWSARTRDLYLTTQNTHKRQTSMPLAEFEPTIPASKRPQTHALGRAATGIGKRQEIGQKLSLLWANTKENFRNI